MQKKISAIINSHFEKGIVLNPDLIDYLDSICEIVSLNDIKGIDPAELDSFYELLFYPDIRLQILIEDVIGESVLDKDQVDEVRALVKRDHVKIIFNDEELTIKVESYFIGQFLKRLRLTNTLINELAIKEIRAEDAVSLRNSGLKSDKRYLSFLRELYDKKEFFTDFYSILKLSLKTLCENSKNELKNVFIEKKLFYATLIQKELHFMELLKKSNIETLMMQGVSTPSVDIEESLNNIKLITRINAVIFNHHNISDHEHLVNMDINVTNDVSDVLELFKN